MVVVVSAMGDTTDELLAMAKQVSSAPDRRELDMLLTAGERISMALLSMAIRELGGDAISFTGSQSGIITNDRHVDARIIEVRPFRVQDELSRGKIVVIAGFQGVSYRREVTTLGRGGSDTTAVAMAAALDAEYCEICSDVDGVYSADPRVVPAARRIGTLSYEETQEMAESGAKVLNAQAVEFAKERGIAIYARATSGPLPGADPSADGTVVRKNPPRMPGTVVGVASERDVLVVESDAGAEDLLPALDEHHVAGKQLHVSTGTGSHRARDLAREPARRGGAARLAARFGERVRFIAGLGAVSAIGSGINATYANVRAGLSVLRDAAPVPRDLDIVVPHHLDGAGRRGRQRRARPPRAIRRIRGSARPVGRVVRPASIAGSEGPGHYASMTAFITVGSAAISGNRWGVSASAKR